MPESRVAVVTGSTSGIGLGIARALAAEGFDLVLNGFGEATTIEALRAQIAHDHDVRVTYSGADMSKPTEVRGLVQRALHELGGIHVLVNNAGIQYTAPVQDFPTERWDAILAINLSAAFHATAEALPTMLKQGWGRILNVASVHGLVASTNKAAYVAAKHGLIGLTRVVALETAKTGVTCNAICPGWVLTPLVQKQIDDLATRETVSMEAARARLLADKQPSGDFATAEQIGSLAVFLCSDDAAQIRGAAMPIDGGWTAQ